MLYQTAQYIEPSCVLGGGGALWAPSCPQHGQVRAVRLSVQLGDYRREKAAGALSAELWRQVLD